MLSSANARPLDLITLLVVTFDLFSCRLLFVFFLSVLYIISIKVLCSFLEFANQTSLLLLFFFCPISYCRLLSVFLILLSSSFPAFLHRETSVIMITITISSKRTGNCSLMTTIQTISGFIPAEPRSCMNSSINFRIELAMTRPVQEIAPGSNRWSVILVSTIFFTILWQCNKDCNVYFFCLKDVKIVHRYEI